jgi:hypothetical protein
MAALTRNPGESGIAPGDCYLRRSFPGVGGEAVPGCFSRFGRGFFSFSCEAFAQVSVARFVWFFFVLFRFVFVLCLLHVWVRRVFVLCHCVSCGGAREGLGGGLGVVAGVGEGLQVVY